MSKLRSNGSRVSREFENYARPLYMASPLLRKLFETENMECAIERAVDARIAKMERCYDC
jgi:hypothetical protein